MILFINSVAVASLVCLWPTDRSGLWWSILVLLFMHWFTTRVAKAAREIDTKEYVVRFWTRANIACRMTCFAASWAGILLSFR